MQHMKPQHIVQGLALGSLLATTPLSRAAEPAPVARESLVNANYRQGMLAFQTRCSGCHSLADGGTDLVGPNLYGVFGRKAGGKPDFSYSDALELASFQWTPAQLAAWLANPRGFLPGTIMQLPEPVPEADRIPLIAYLMHETGAADWPKPQPPRVAGAGNANAPLAERYPSFWNHLMSNTTRYRLQGAAGELKFDAWFNTNGTVTTSLPGAQGFWRETPGEQFCYALQGLPGELRQLIECFPIVAMSIPRFREELWTTAPAPGIKLIGGIVAGRPQPTGAPER